MSFLSFFKNDKREAAVCEVAWRMLVFLFPMITDIEGNVNNLLFNSDVIS